MGTSKGDKAPGALAPLRRRAFAVLWFATVLGNTGTFMRDVASSWLVTDLTASPSAVAMIQVAGTVPVFLLAIPAGVLSDILDRRKFLLAIQVLLALVSTVLTVLAAGDWLTVEALIGLTLVGGVGAALMAPTWQSIVPELVPKDEMRSAVALNSLGVNIARSIGPAAGGAILAAGGAALTYASDVLSYLIVISALLWWRRSSGGDDPLRERFGGAFRAGLRYAWSSSALHIVALRALIYFAFASAIWALLPLVARNLLQGGPGFYGVLLGSVGAGAVAGAFVLPAVRARISADALILFSALISAAVTSALALSPPQWLAVLLLFVLGAAWIAALTTFNGVAQAILPGWVRGRGLAIYLTVFSGAMALGGLVWGLTAQAIGLPGTLAMAGLGLAVTAAALFPIRLPRGEEDLSPSNHWPEPLIAADPGHDRGPVLILIEYRIRIEDHTAFRAALTQLARARRRDGAYAWGVTEDAADPERVLEWFMVESWAEHMRQHRRVSHADADVQQAVARFHQSASPPKVEHFIALAPRSGP